MNIFFTSDLHFYHANVIKYCNRPWDSAEEMNEGLIANWNSVVRDNDKVWILGDLFFCGHEESLSILKRLKGRKHLILGNHDKMIRNQKQVQAEFERVYPDLYEESIAGVKVVMCHYPLLTWNKAHYGSFMLHGHSHGTARYPFTGRIMDVGVDSNNYTPISWEDIHQKLSGVEFGFNSNHSRE